MTVIMITVSTTEPTVYTRAKYSWKSPHFRSGPHDAGFPLPVLAQGLCVRPGGGTQNSFMEGEAPAFWKILETRRSHW